MKKATKTRLYILQKAFELIYAKGYRTTSIDDILLTTGLTKGAFYYHFKNKDEMGLAIISEVLKPALQESFTSLRSSDENPLDEMYHTVYHLLLESSFLKREYGCPASNIAQEMCPWNQHFTTAVHELTEQWFRHFIERLETGKENGQVKGEVDSAAVVRFVFSGYWGIRNMGKLESDGNVYASYLEELKNYLLMKKN